ncbi:class I SAM-dependent methyltransferase [Fredinandcohnia sp. 179-A 10B2 NHS]|uniref:class I SAM-dependent methyltransferase n=1 Tax=Fredinandcohnia sp. 179-A 10B2 NHS TaxID=3235176 RepID=UPI0039A05896
MKYSYLECLSLYGVGGAHPGGLSLTKQLLLKENVAKDTAILDVGCGTGLTSAYLAKQFRCHVTAMDNNRVMLEKARRRFRQTRLPITLVYGTTEKLPFEDKSFDLLLSESVTIFTHVTASLGEYKRVLKPKGIFLGIEMVVDPNCPSEVRKEIADFYGISKLLSVSEWQAYFKKAGFREVSILNVETSKHVDQFEANDFIPSKDIDPRCAKVIEKHEELTEKYFGSISYRVFRCVA